MALSTQQKILRIASELFAERGFSDANMRDVAERAKLSLPTIYHHFGSKEQLYQRACTSVFGKKAKVHLDALTKSDAPTDEARLLHYYTAFATDLAQDRVYFNLLHREFLERNATGQAQLSQDSFGPAFFEAAKICKRLCPERNSVVLALSLHGMVMGLSDVLRFGVHLDQSLTELCDPAAVAKLTLFNLIPHVRWGYVELPEPDRDAAPEVPLPSERGRARSGRRPRARVSTVGVKAAARKSER